MNVSRSCVLWLVVIAVCGLAPPVAAGIGPWQFIRGDFDGDGDNDLADGVGILSYLFVDGAAAPLCEDAADVNDDGAIDLIDAVYQLTHAVAGGTAPPSPYPACGVDLTFDFLGCEGPLAFCPEADLPPNVTAVYSDDFSESTVGIQMVANIAAVTPGNFDELRFLMRPLNVQLGSPGGSIQVTLTGPLELFDAAGNNLGNPAVIPAAQLPTEILLNATGSGVGELVAVQVGAGGSIPDEILVNVSDEQELAGRELPNYPFFEFVRTVNSDEASMQTALDPSRYADRTGQDYRVYIVEHRTPAEWAADNTLVDITGGFEVEVVGGTSIQDSIVDAWMSPLDPGVGVIGKAYDVVFDFGLDGTLDPGDLVDGLDYDQAGVYVVGDLTDLGPHAVTETLYSGGSFLGQNLYYPTDIDNLTNVPIVVISHGNGHQYTWYDYLGNHLASWGYVVMSHQNNTVPGIETSSTTTLTNTDYLLDNLSTIAGGALDGHVDTNWIAWIGHSRGGEGVVRAYDRLIDGPLPGGIGFDETQIQFVSSIAPTVFLSTTQCDPHDVTYHLLAGAADGDVNGCADCSVCQFFRIHQRATGITSATYVQGADHNDFNCCGFQDGQGPAQIGRPQAQNVAKAYYLAHLDWFARGNFATKDYLVRDFDAFHPVGIGGNVVVANQWNDPNEVNLVVEDYQTQTSTTVSSSGAAVAFDVTSVTEGVMDDANSNFSWTPGDAMNGMTQAEFSPDSSRGAVFEWPFGSQRFYEFDLPAGGNDVTTSRFLTFRACQGTRHPNTNALAGPLDFTVTLIDGDGVMSSINFGDLGGLTRPYLRSGCGSGSGWANEFNIVRLRLSDYQNDGSGIDLTNVTKIRFEFGDGFGSTRGRIGLDDVQLTND
ncbi:MAG: hypothetical protein AAF488_01720 [Planctomycetota bacterium]